MSDPPHPRPLMFDAKTLPPPWPKPETTMTDDMKELLKLQRETVERLKSSEEKRVTHADLQHFGDTMMAAHRHSDAKLDALVSRVDGMQGQLNVQGIALTAVVDRVTKVEARAMSSSRPSPQPRKYDPEETSPGGGLRIPPAEWKSAMEQIDTLTDEREAELKAKQQAQERQAAITEYANGLEKEAKRKRHRMVKIISVLTPFLLALGGWVAHTFHL